MNKSKSAHTVHTHGASNTPSTNPSSVPSPASTPPSSIAHHTATPSSPGSHLVSESSIDLLHFTIVDTYWRDLEEHPEKPVIKASDPTLSRRKRKLQEEEERKKYETRVLLYDGEKHPERVYAVIEEMGFHVGQRAAERLARDRSKFSDNLDMIKFLCKEFWTGVFKKQIDNLRTNHRGTYVLSDNKFRYVQRLSGQSHEDTVKSAQRYIIFPCGMIRGALSVLGIDCIVVAELKIPSVTFTITERSA